jgi:anti-anti-sigma factor
MLRFQPYAFTIDRTNGYCVVHAEGELDIASIGEMQAAVSAACRRAHDVVVDLRDVAFMDTYALRALAMLQWDMDDCRLHVVSGEGVQRVLDVTGARAALSWISPEQLGS